jgi:predicted ester cyclase
MKGFDAEFTDLDHYIRVITDRIWEGRRIDDIRRYYSDDCAVETPSSVSIGVQPVIDGTRATLLAFPDRRLLAEDVIASGDDMAGYLSSHRIFSPMTHAGAGVFGAPTGRVVCARTIADCVCINNRIVHEWLVRDQAAIARQIGLHERDVAQRWLNERGGFHKAAMPAAPAPYVSFIDTHVAATAYAEAHEKLWSGTALSNTYHADVIAAIPGGEARVGLAASNAFWRCAAHFRKASSTLSIWWPTNALAVPPAWPCAGVCAPNTAAAVVTAQPRAAALKYWASTTPTSSTAKSCANGC